MIKWDLSWGCKDSSFYVNQSMWYTTLTNWKIKSIWSSQSVQFSHSVVSDSLWPHGQQHARPPCPSPTPGIYSNSCPLIRWCHPTISSSVVPFSSHLQSFPASGSFQMSQFFASVAKVLEFQLQHQSFQWILRTGFLLNRCRKKGNDVIRDVWLGGKTVRKNKEVLTINKDCLLGQTLAGFLGASFWLHLNLGL